MILRMHPFACCLVIGCTPAIAINGFVTIDLCTGKAPLKVKFRAEIKSDLPLGWDSMDLR